MASKEQGSFREKLGKGAIAGGIVAALIGLVIQPELILLGGGLAAGGYILKKSGKKAA